MRDETLESLLKLNIIHIESHELNTKKQPIHCTKINTSKVAAEKLSAIAISSRQSCSIDQSRVDKTKRYIEGKN